MKIFVSILILFFAYNLVSACSCLTPTDESKDEALKNASFIFRGKVVSANESDEGKPFNNTKIRFDVSRAWKGVEKNEIVINTPLESAACGYSFKMNETYLVYAHGNPAATTSCTMMQVDENRVREAFGDGKSFEQSALPPTETTEGFWARLWHKITSIFS